MSTFQYRELGGFNTLVCEPLFSEFGIKHGFITNQLDLKQYNVENQFLLKDIGSISLAKQTHSNKVINCSEFGREGDSIVLGPGEGAGVKTADCVPLILVDLKTKNRGAVVHAGWRGAENGVLRNTIDNFGGDLSEFCAIIGPCAYSCCYEVGVEVAEKFSTGTYLRDAKVYLSVSEALISDLKSAGMARERIYSSGICTICSQMFFSYRKEGVTSGRFLTFLAL